MVCTVGIQLEEEMTELVILGSEKPFVDNKEMRGIPLIFPAHSNGSHTLLDALKIACNSYGTRHQDWVTPDSQSLNMSPPSLLPTASYTSSFNPTSPKGYSHPDRTPSPPRNRRPSLKPFYPPESARSTQPLHIPHALASLLTPRVLSPIILWSVAIYLIHSYLLPLPLPQIRVSSKPHGPKAADHFLSSYFPQPPQREGDDSLDSIDPRYRPFSPLPSPDAPFPRLRPTRFLPTRCLDQWFADGETTCGGAELGEEEQLDVTWLWVNGSDTRWRDLMIYWREQEKVYSPEHHFR
jgi:3-O-alpha-D-mannopyranosyl-alpha-D-mannopyranose xylosylphosphotransferase